MIINFTIAEFCQLQAGDPILINLDGSTKTATIEGYAFYNADADQPGWEIDTDCGFVSIDSAYKEITPKTAEQVQLIALEQFKSLKNGNVIFVPYNDCYMPAVVCSPSSKSHSLENILNNAEDWEVETNLGFIHNDSAYIER